MQLGFRASLTGYRLCSVGSSGFSPEISSLASCVVEGESREFCGCRVWCLPREVLDPNSFSLREEEDESGDVYVIETKELDLRKGEGGRS